MKTIITTSTVSATGFALQITHDDGTIETKPIDKVVPDKATNGAFDWYILPENPANRSMINSKRIKAGLELTYREPRKPGEKPERVKSSKPTPKKIDVIEEYLTEEELKVWNSLKEKAQLRATLAKAKAEAEAAQAEYERLLAEAQA